MELDIEQTRIDVVEQKADDISFTDYISERSVMFIASLEGKSTEGHYIEMDRAGKTPDEAIKNLFEAMTEAGVTL